jgi:hypothetical protein
MVQGPAVFSVTTAVELDTEQTLGVVDERMTGRPLSLLTSRTRNRASKYWSSGRAKLISWASLLTKNERETDAAAA